MGNWQMVGVFSITKKKYLNLHRILLWALVAIYTLALPHAIFVYNAITKHFSASIAENIPVYILVLFGITYIAVGFIKKKHFRCIGFILPGAIIAYAIVSYEPNPNKHIHLPEYVLMTWILFAAISLDYRGKGMFILVFLCSSLLGIVDELQQGIHPYRHYGLWDMELNSIASFIGILTLSGLEKNSAGDWNWISYINERSKLMALLIFGTVGATLTCKYFFTVAANKTFWASYPIWLVGWNSLYIILCPAMFLFHIRRLHAFAPAPSDDGFSNRPGPRITVYLWINTLLSIFFAMHVLAVFTAISGWEFG